MVVKIKQNKVEIINELNKREQEKTVSFEYAYEKWKRFINNLWK